MDTRVLYLGITNVIPKLAGSIINISGARLYLKEVKMNHVFISVTQLTNDLFQTYLRKILS